MADPERNNAQVLFERQRKQRLDFVLGLINQLKLVGIQAEAIPGSPYTGFQACVLTENFDHAQKGDYVFIEERGAVLKVPSKNPDLWSHLSDYEYPKRLLELLEQSVGARIKERQALT